MAEIAEQDYRVRVELMEGYQFKVTFRDERPSLWMDEPEPVGEGEFPNAGLILAASVGNCLAASLTYCLRKARAEVRGMRADVSPGWNATNGGGFESRTSASSSTTSSTTRRSWSAARTSTRNFASSVRA